MSKVFVTGDESWDYCPKARERCMRAEIGKECTYSGCVHSSKKISYSNDSDLGGRIVRRKKR